MLALQVHDFRLELLERLVACRHRPAQTFDLGFRLAVIGGLLECPRILLPQPLRQLHGVCIGVRNIHQQLRQHDSDSAGQAGYVQRKQLRFRSLLLELRSFLLRRHRSQSGLIPFLLQLSHLRIPL